MPRMAALWVPVTLLVALTACSQEGSDEANGSVRLEVIGSQPGESLKTEWDPQPAYFGTVVNVSDTITEYRSVPVGNYTLTASEAGKTATTQLTVTEGETSEVTVTLK